MPATMRLPVILCSLLLLSACAGEQRLPLAKIDFAGRPPIALTVATVEVVDDYTPPKELPHVEHAAPVPPYTAVRNWAGQRLKAEGQTGFVRVDIRDASIVQKKLVNQIEYDGSLDVTFEADSGNGQHSATADVTIERQVIVDADLDLAQKENIWNDLTRQMMTDFDARAQKVIARDLGAFGVGG